jgi:hypothetical protein
MAVLYRPLDDPSWKGVEVNALIMAETSVYLISTCMLQFPPLLKYLFSETGVVRIGRSGVFMLASLQPQARNARHTQRKDAWNSSEVGLRQDPSKKSSDNGAEEAENPTKEEIVITSEFSISYSAAEASEVPPFEHFARIGLPEGMERAPPPDRI